MTIQPKTARSESEFAVGKPEGATALQTLGVGVRVEHAVAERLQDVDREGLLKSCGSDRDGAMGLESSHLTIGGH